MEQRKRELDNWDALFEKVINRLQFLSILRGIDWRHPQSNCSTHTTMAKFQALTTWDP